MTQKALTVSQLNEYIKEMFSRDDLLAGICLMGEISNFKRHSSGHLYFTLKDSQSVISAVMFRGDAMRLRFSPDNGMKVIVMGRVSVYPKNGQYQVYVSVMQPDGIGSLYMAFEQLKERLYEKGLFDQSRKKPLPPHPNKIALITSPTGAAVRDMIRILRVRYPLCNVVVCPVKVQGEGAAEEIAAMIKYVNVHSLADIIITGRGGGSFEDLWAFNEETVAYAIYNSDIPVISAVGHEPDITISDYVADVRASTPSNAAEIAVPDIRQFVSYLHGAADLMTKYQMNIISSYRERLERASNRPVMQGPGEYFNERRMYLASLEDNLVSNQNLILERKRRHHGRLAAELDALSPLKVLSRGYSMVSGKNGVVKSVKNISPGEDITVVFSDGRGVCTVNEVISDPLRDQKEQNNG